MTHRGEIHSGPNRFGEYCFTLFWWADYHPGHPLGEYRHAERGQVFLADPKTYDHPGLEWVDKRFMRTSDKVVETLVKA